MGTPAKAPLFSYVKAGVLPQVHSQLRYFSSRRRRTSVSCSAVRVRWGCRRAHLIQQPALELLQRHGLGQVVGDVGHGQMADIVPLDRKQSFLWWVVIWSRTVRSDWNSSVPWCRTRPPVTRWALPEIFRSPIAMSQVRLFRAGTPMAFRRRSPA